MKATLWIGVRRENITVAAPGGEKFLAAMENGQRLPMMAGTYLECMLSGGVVIGYGLVLVRTEDEIRFDTTLAEPDRERVRSELLRHGIQGPVDICFQQTDEVQTYVAH